MTTDSRGRDADPKVGAAAVDVDDILARQRPRDQEGAQAAGEEQREHPSKPQRPCSATRRRRRSCLLQIHPGLLLASCCLLADYSKQHGAFAKGNGG
eukprot:CAMPEP_0184274980 /NCGR_PEP_ID=MMETSP0977-20130417/46545_1 /TAXON_ID=483370 /ORGANISM="non described non described, Strain CCMP2097" /LENGTH=96 /DNA_ID=CAMNT_0026580865 /DNA_START=74 /DNA_END=361 /DNA_ORIENTATION=-